MVHRGSSWDAAEASPTRVFNSARVFSQAGAWPPSDGPGPPTGHRDAGSPAESVDGGSARARATVRAVLEVPKGAALLQISGWRLLALRGVRAHASEYHSFF